MRRGLFFLLASFWISSAFGQDIPEIEIAIDSMRIDSLEIADAEEEFLSKEDLQQRGRVSRAIIDYLDELGCLEGMPEANQLSLF